MPQGSDRAPLPTGGSSLVGRTGAVASACGAYAALGGLVSLLGWVLDLPRLADWAGIGISTQPNTALAAIAAGVALIALTRGRRAIALAGAAVAASFGGATLVEHVAGLDLGVDRLLVFDRDWGSHATVSGGRMGPPAAFSWTCLGIALVLAARGAGRARSVSVVLATAALAVSSFSVVGYAFEADPLYAAPRLTAIALQTATFLFVTSIGVLAALPDRQPMRRLLEDGAAGRLVRRMLPFIVGVPPIVGLLLVLGQDAGWYDAAFGAAVLVLLLIALLVCVQWWSTTTVADYERRLREDRQRLADTLESISDQCQVIDATWRCVYQNSAHRRALLAHGIDADAALGRLFFDVFPELRDTEAASSLRRAMAERERTQCEFFYAPWRRWYAMRAAPTPDGGLAVLLLDTTTRHDADIERERLLASEREARASAERLNRVKDEFLATLSHELRTPLNSILGWSHVLRARTPTEATLAQGLEVIERNARSQAQLISDLLDMSRIVSGKLRLHMEPVRIERVVDAALDAVRPAAEAKGIDVHRSLAPLGVMVLGDADRLQQVVWNLASNAVKFTPPGGRVDVELARGAECVELTVRDTGKGMSAEFLPLVFEKFRQADSSSSRAHGGLGLGLAIVKQLVELHGGRVRAESDGEGRGSPFAVELPLRAPPVATAEVERHDAAASVDPTPLDDWAGRLEGVRALVVDDDRDALVLVRRLLEECGAVVCHAASARLALAALEDFAPDVIVSDIGMPEIDGYGFMRRVRDRGITAPAIALTAFARTDDRARALASGYQSHLAKPIALPDLVAAVASAVRREPAST